MFRNRTDAGRQLAAKLMDYRDRPGVLVLGLPRGGVPVEPTSDDEVRELLERAAHDASVAG